MSMNESRRYERFSLDNADVNCNILFASDVNILNISITGVALRADRRLDIGREYMLKLIYQDNVVSLAGTVMWSIITGSKKNKSGEFVPLYTAGVRFKDVISDKMAELIKFIEAHKTEEDKRVTSQRFTVKSPEKASLNYPDSCKVKKISLGGILIEAGEEFEIEDRFHMDILVEDTVIGCQVRVASCNEMPDSEPKAYAVGIEFLEMHGDGHDRLRELIDSLNAEA